MHIHIAGICGTFMGGLALIARELGHTVSGTDQSVYPPMSTQLEQQGIRLCEGYDPCHLDPQPDLVIFGNALSRGNALVEAVLNQGLPYTSGPQWLADNVLHERWVLAVAGTHGKTTTSSMLAWILEHAGLAPGFLIGGVPPNFGRSARLGSAPFFVIEADEYDCAFFDKRSKFIHYRPRTLVLNNLEFDHADIFADLDAIKKQFHHLLRTVPGNGKLIVNQDEPALADVLAMGCWSECEHFAPAAAQTPQGGAQWQARLESEDGSHWEVLVDGVAAGSVHWPLVGDYNVTNALAAVAAARHAGVPVNASLAALEAYQPVKRRMELRGEVRGIRVYDDFAHHPTAIRLSIEALRRSGDSGKLVAVLEPRSNSMRLGAHRDGLAAALSGADRVAILRPADLPWDLDTVIKELGPGASAHDSTAEIVDRLAGELDAGDRVLIMSNGAFDGIHEKLLKRLQQP
jgi:UDP-N-acetylmuramate: L-alanyl-gamma-D-glutamyl-meso-diaminopimelate ligase